MDQGLVETLTKALSTSLPDVIDHLQSAVVKFSKAFRVDPESGSSLEEPSSSGLGRIKGSLLHCLECKLGTEEELVAIFVAVLRALGLLVRSVRALEPLPLRPCAQQDEGRQRGRLKAMNKQAISKVAPRTRSQPVSIPGGDDEGEGPGATSLSRSATAPPAGGPLAKNPKKGAGRGKRLAAPEVPSTTSPPGGGGRGRGRKRSRSSIGESVEVNPTGEQLMTASEDRPFSSGGAQEQPVGSDAPVATKQNRGDAEFEAQLAMALCATARVEELKEADRGRAETTETEAPSSSKKERTSYASRHRKGPPASSATPGMAWSSLRAAPVHWAEVFCGSMSSGKWIVVDPIRQWVDRPHAVEQGTCRERSLTYVVAYGDAGPKDVTKRYAASYMATMKLRDEQWWQVTLGAVQLRTRPLVNNISRNTSEGSYQAACPGPSPSSYHLHGRGPVPDLVTRREDAEMEEKVLAERRGLPTSIEGFKHHPLVILQRHITKYQALMPGAPVLGLHRGEPYYSRSDLQELHTVERWRREGREVPSEELGSPAKVVKKRGADSVANNQRAAEEEVEEDIRGNSAFATINLYGRWQTIPWVPPVAEGGVVPKNERGNVECPPLASSLPFGTVHIALPNVAPVCRSLGIDFAPALVGFEPQAGRMVPRIEGVVVCSEFETSVVQEYVRREEEKARRMAERRLRDGCEAWSRLLNALILRRQLDQTPGQEQGRGLQEGGPRRPQQGGATAEGLEVSAAGQLTEKPSGDGADDSPPPRPSSYYGGATVEVEEF